MSSREPSAACRPDAALALALALAGNSVWGLFELCYFGSFVSRFGLKLGCELLEEPCREYVVMMIRLVMHKAGKGRLRLAWVRLP